MIESQEMEKKKMVCKEIKELQSRAEMGRDSDLVVGGGEQSWVTKIKW